MNTTSTDTQTYITRAVAALVKSKLTLEEQLDIEQAITSLSDERNWTRQRAAVVLHTMAYPH